MNLLKALLGITLIKGVSVPRGIKKSKQATNTIFELIVVLSGIVYFLVQTTYKIIEFILKSVFYIIKYIYRKFCTKATVVVEEEESSNIVSLEQYKNNKKKVV